MVKSYWVTVTEGYFKKIEHKQFFKVSEANKFHLEMLEMYKDKKSEDGSSYVVVKEYY
jgi:hypothetical protein